MTPTLRPTALAVATLAAVALALTGCASTSEEAQITSLAALDTPVAKGTSTGSSTTSKARCGDPTASLRPRSAVPADRFMQHIRRRGYLIAGVDQNTLLFGYLRPSTGRIEGFEIDLLRQVARAIFGDPNRIQLRALTTTQRLPFVQSGLVDVVADAVTIRCDRLRDVLFSSVYFEAEQRLLVPARSPARSLADLAHRRVCATTGSTSILRIERDPANPIPVPVAQRTDCLVLLQQGKVDAITSDDAILLGYRAQDPNTRIVGPSLAPQPYGMAIAKTHPAFVRFVNGVLERMRRDGTWTSIHRRWLGGVAPTPTPPHARYRD